MPILIGFIALVVIFGAGAVTGVLFYRKMYNEFTAREDARINARMEALHRMDNYNNTDRYGGDRY